MSATAEVLAPIDERQLSYVSGLVGDMVLDRADVWLAADDIPALRSARLEADNESARIYESYMGIIRQGIAEGVPLDGDAVSTADDVLALKRRFGAASPQYHQAYQGLLVNNQRYIAEAWSKRAAEYFAPLRQVYDAEKDDYTFHGAAITPMIHRGITPLADTREVPRRFMENRENTTNNRMGRLVMKLAGVDMPATVEVPEVGLPLELRRTSVSVQTISECPDYIQERYQADLKLGRERSYGGYAPQVGGAGKSMLRSTRFDPITGERYVEQMSVLGAIDHKVVVTYLESKGVVAEGVSPDKTEVLGLQVITDNEDGVVGMARDMDVIASRLNGQNIFLGQVVPVDHPKDYDAIPAAAEARQRKQQADAIELTEYTLELAASGLDHAVASELVAARVKAQMFEASKADLSLAAIAFDDQTANALKKAQEVRGKGDDMLARQLEEQAERLAPPPDACEGTCEVRSVDTKTAKGAELAKLTRAKSGDKLAVDESKARRCKCGGQFAYAYNDGKVNTACLGCKAFRSKKSSVSSQKQG